jgi:MoaD family protein
MATEGTDRIRVTVKVFGALRDLHGTDARCLGLPGNASLEDLMVQLSEEVAELVAKLRAGLVDGYIHVLVNGRNARFLDSMRTLLHDGDVVAFLPPLGGG